MSGDDPVLDRLFNRPSGSLGRIGAVLMARLNGSVSVEVVDHLEPGPDDSLLEIGFGPGLGIERAAEIAPKGCVAGVDVSPMMVERARARNEAALVAGRVDLRQGSAEDLPFADGRFDAAFSINSLHAWSNQRAGLLEIHRVLKPGGTVAIALTKHAGSPDEPLEDALRGAGFDCVRTTDAETAAVRGYKPSVA